MAAIPDKTSRPAEPLEKQINAHGRSHVCSGRQTGWTGIDVVSGGSWPTDRGRPAPRELRLMRAGRARRRATRQPEDKHSQTPVRWI